MLAQHQTPGKKEAGDQGNDFWDEAEEHLSWEMSQLPFLSQPEKEALLDLPSAWLEARGWSPDDGCNAELLWEYSERHGISGAIGALAMAGKVTSERLADLGRHRYLSNVLHHERCLAVCTQLQEQAKRNGISMSIMKGPVLATEAYQNTGVRAYGDVDVFVKSKADARKLIHSMEYECLAEATGGNIFRRMKEPGRFHVQMHGWELEFCYPINQPCDPTFELLSCEGDRLLQIPTLESALSIPDPSVHFMFLILHIIRHLCSRLIWFLDIAAFYRHNRRQLDMEWISEKLDDLEMRNAASLISQACLQHIDGEFPKIERVITGWNHRFQKQAISFDQAVNRTIPPYQDHGRRKLRAGLISSARFFLLTDPASHSFFHRSCAARWSSARLLYAARIESGFVHRILEKLTVIFFLPFARLVAFFAVRL